MRPVNNDCGGKNVFGHYDRIKKEIVLKRANSQSAHIREAYEWIDRASDLERFSYTITALDEFLSENMTHDMYNTARSLLLETMSKSRNVDNEILFNILTKISEREQLRSLTLRCCIFYDAPRLFDVLINTLKSLPCLVYLDLTGCYFSDNQLVTLANVVKDSSICSMVWPDPMMNSDVLQEVTGILEKASLLVVLTGVPSSLKKIAQAHRDYLFSKGDAPIHLDDENVSFLKKCKDAVALAIGFERERLLNLEKNFDVLWIETFK